MMVAERLTSAMLAGALRRLADREGGFSAILAGGDSTSGALLVQLLEKGAFYGLFERALGVRNSYGWIRTGPGPSESSDTRDAYLARRRSRDPDLWIVELDIPDAERFIAESLSAA